MRINASPYERYGIRIYPAHAHTIAEEAKADMAFQGWRFLQDMATLTSGIVEGTWQEKGSGFHFEEEIKSDSSGPPREAPKAWEGACQATCFMVLPK
jgi:hypothetical protein